MPDDRLSAKSGMVEIIPVTDRQAINERGVIVCPDLIVVADDTLVPVPAAGVLAGADAHSVMLIYSSETQETWQARLNYPGRLIVLPVRGEVEDRAELRTVGATCAAAAARLTGVITWPLLEQALRDELVELGEAVVQDNLHKAAEAYAVLSDAQKRQRYDQFGHQGVSGAGGFDPETFGDFADILGDFFGFGFGDMFGGGRRRGGRQPGADLRYELHVVVTTNHAQVLVVEYFNAITAMILGRLAGHARSRERTPDLATP